MKRITIALILSSVLALCGCAGSSTSGEAAATQVACQEVAFKGVELQVPETWTEQELDPGTMEAVAGRSLTSEEHNGQYNNVILYSMLYEAYGNTDTQMPDPSDPLQQEIKRKLDLGLKALDARVMLEMVAGAWLGGEATATVDQAAFHLKDLQGHAAWYYEWNGPAYSLFAYSIAFDERIVAVAVFAPLEQLSDDAKLIADSVAATEATDALILEKAKLFEGLSQDEAMDVIAEDAQIPAPASSSSSSSSGSGSSSSSGGNNGGESVYDSPTGDTWVQTDYGDILQFGEDGSVTLYNDDGVTTFNEDGTREWTDGWGTVVRDDDGDGTPDRVSYDSGETWTRL